MLIVDQEGRIVLANNQAAQLFGYSDGQLEGRRSKFWFRRASGRSIRGTVQDFSASRARGRWVSG